MSLPTRIKAAVSRRYGPPEVVHTEEIDTPLPGDDELLVEIRATTVNRTDCGYRSGKPFMIRFFSGLRRPKTRVCGTEFAGVVAAVGPAVTRFQVGARVCGYCEGTFGAHAEYLTICETRLVVPIPEGRSFEQAAPSTEGSHYALSILRKVEVGPGSDVLVYGATGAIGSAAVQIAKDLGARVTAVCGTRHLEMVKGLGADRVVDHQTEDFTKDPQKYDLVLDAVGKSSFFRCRRLLKAKGAYCATDRPWAYKPFLFVPVFIGWLGQVAITRLFRGRRVVFVVPHKDPEGIRYLKGLIESGKFRPVLDEHRYTLDEIAEAYRFVETGQKIGNVVITV
jgi:NADPH:quinone reductase-like Zn-dependent oxidoreductase